MAAARRISAFQKTTKLYFSSLSARGCTKLYINLPGREDELVLSNADPDLLATYSLRDLIAIHVIRPTPEYMQAFREIFFHGGDPYQPFLIKTEFITRSFKDYRIEDTISNLDKNNNLQILGGGKQLIVTSSDSSSDIEEESVEDGEQKEVDWDFKGELEKLLEDDGWDTEVKRAIFKDAATAGVPLSDPFIIDRLLHLIDEMESSLKMCQQQQDHGIIAITANELLQQSTVHANWYRTPPFLASQLIPELDPKNCVKQTVLLIDGLSIPSIREFLKKYKWVDGHDKFHLYIYLYTEKTIKTIACFEAADGSRIITARPHFYEMLIMARPLHVQEQTGRDGKTLKEVLHHGA